MKWTTEQIASMICLIIAGVLAYYDKEGWGWFLFAALILF